MASGDSTLIEIPATESQPALMAGNAQQEMTEFERDAMAEHVCHLPDELVYRDQPQYNLSPHSLPRTEDDMLVGGSAAVEIWRLKDACCYIKTKRERIPLSGVISGVTVQHHEDNDLNLLCKAYQLVKDEKKAWTLDDDLLNLKSPIGSNILHIAASYGNDKMVDEVIDKASHLSHLFTAKNSNDDTPLHVAARAGRFSPLQKLLHGYFKMVENDESEILSEKNKKGNTVLHDILIGKQNEDAIIRLFDEIIPNSEGKPLSTHVYDVALEVTNEKGKSALYLAVKLGCKNFVNWILEKCNKDKIPQGKSPLLAAIKKQDLGMLEAIITKKREWMHLEDEEGMIPLHWAASTGFLPGVGFLLRQCGNCSIKSDKNGFYALHLASEGGHVEVLKKLLSDCPNPKEIVDKNGRNILHFAAAKGQLNVVKHILQDPNLKTLINEMDADGNTPLHLATLHSRPKVVYALTWDQKVNLRQKNLRNQTALDINLEQVDGENQPLSQRLVWIALKSAGTLKGSKMILTKNYAQNPEEKSSERKKGPNLEQFKDRIDTLVVVSTLIITATFAGGFSLPGGSEKGVAVMLQHTMFHFYIYCITISMYGAISATLILIWARLGDISLLALSLQLAKPLLGITIVTLSLAFLAGVYLVISPLGWLATSFLIIATIGAIIVALLYIILWLPSKSRFIVCRYLSYVPFHLLASVAERDDDNVKHKGSKH